MTQLQKRGQDAYYQTFKVHTTQIGGADVENITEVPLPIPRIPENKKAQVVELLRMDCYHTGAHSAPIAGASAGITVHLAVPDTATIISLFDSPGFLGAVMQYELNVVAMESCGTILTIIILRLVLLQLLENQILMFLIGKMQLEEDFLWQQILSLLPTSLLQQLL